MKRGWETVNPHVTCRRGKDSFPGGVGETFFSKGADEMVNLSPPLVSFISLIPIRRCKILFIKILTCGNVGGNVGPKKGTSGRIGEQRTANGTDEGAENGGSGIVEWEWWQYAWLRDRRPQGARPGREGVGFARGRVAGVCPLNLQLAPQNGARKMGEMGCAK